LLLAPSKHHSLEGREHGRTIPLAVIPLSRWIGVVCHIWELARADEIIE
jgi:hypothetical protein